LPLALGVLQILCLDLLTDQSPALALGGQPPGRRVLLQRPGQTRLIDRELLGRALLLGVTEATVALAAFFGVLWQAGFRPGKVDASSAAVASASGAAFLAVVVGQTATALACRSASRPAWQVPLRDNPALLTALAASWLVTAALLGLPPFPRLLGQAWPTSLGALTALAAFPLVLAVDAAYKARLSRRAELSVGEGPVDQHLEDAKRTHHLFQK
jgi:magnesium-transporting ATPase (P-type)